MNINFSLRWLTLAHSFLFLGVMEPNFKLPEKYELSFLPATYAPPEPTKLQDREPTGSGLYLGVSGVYAIENFDLDEAFGTQVESTLGGDVDIENSWGFGINLGYRFSPYFSLEAEYERYDEFEVKFNGSQVGTIEGWSLMANLKAYLSASENWQPYLLIGAGRVEGEFSDDSILLSVNETEDDMAVQGGVGFDIVLNRALAFNVEGKYVQPLDDLEDFRFGVVSAGFVFRF